MFNATSNSTNSTIVSMPNEFDWIDIILLVTFILIFIIGVFGNGLVCYYFKFKGSRKLAGMEILILYLASIDFISSIINPLLYFYWQVTFNSEWHFGYVGCKIIPAFAKVLTFMSFGIILTITIDRCIVICSPFHIQVKKKHLQLCVLIVFIVSMLCEVPDIYYYEIYPGYTCLVADSEDPGFLYPTIVFYILRDLLFLLIFFISIFLIHWELYNKETILTLKDQKDLKKTKKIVRMLIILAVVFIILVYPRDILHLTYMFTIIAPPGIPYSKDIIDINDTLKLLHMSNSICNVFIYAGLHKHFRQKIIHMIKHLIYGNHGKQQRALTGITVFSQNDDDDDCFIEKIPISSSFSFDENSPETCI